ncbi:MAG: NMD3 family-domain-containing protein [Piptocephalis tieghemiana]|nr:MAG: NMD3 family-domain-containing protein [Piptocephalis tieghemiana]
MCADCVRNEVDITEGIPKQATIHFCRNCERYLQPPAHWVVCTLESRELLALCLKKLRGLNKVRLVDAGFLWTEPHSRRIKVKLTIQKEVFAATILQQQFEVEYVVSAMQCEDCAKVMASNTWKAMVQVRQKVPHKRTFLYLEQLILKHGAHKDTINIKEAKDGLDFYYSQRSHAIRMCEFLSAVVPLKTKSSEQLISSDIHNNTSNYRFTYSVELVPICKDDLICLPHKLANSLGNISPLVLCSKVSNSLQVIDPNTLQAAEVSCPVYYRTPFPSLASVSSLVEYYVLDVELCGPRRGKYALADVQVARVSDFGKNDTTFFARSHLGNILNAGDHALGFDLSKANFNNDAFEALNHNGLPDVILVKKSYPIRRARNRGRAWRLKHLAKEVEDGMAPRKQEQERVEQDLELFLRDLEEDPELRSTVNLYKHANKPKKDAIMGESSDMEEEDFPEIRLEELLDDLRIDDGPEAEENQI